METEHPIMIGEGALNETVKSVLSTLAATAVGFLVAQFTRVSRKEYLERTAAQEAWRGAFEERFGKLEHTVSNNEHQVSLQLSIINGNLSFMTKQMEAIDRKFDSIMLEMKKHP